MSTDQQVPRVDPLYLHKASITIIDVQKHRYLIKYLKHMWRYYRNHFDFPRDVNSILNEVPPLCFVPCFLLAYTCCRVSELKELKLSSIIDNKPFKIHSTKSEHIRYVQSLPVYDSIHLNQIPKRTRLVVISYDHLRTMIRHAKMKAGIKKNKNILDVTHIFRHLTATHLSRKGVSVKDIAMKLGHLSTDSTQSYIH